MPIACPRATLAAILAEAAREPAREVCGLLFGRDDAIESHRPCRNIDPDPAHAFEIDPAQLLAAHRAARCGGPAVIGHYHSHPRGQAVPSPRDAAALRPGQLWLIVAQGEARLWRAHAAGFDEAVLATG